MRLEAVKNWMTDEVFFFRLFPQRTEARYKISFMLTALASAWLLEMRELNVKFARSTTSGAASAHSNLFEGALPRLLIWAPAEELGAVTKAPACEVIILNFDNQLRL
jgi:hypothetical protein